jgi:predicted MFS family arabinose efflux permease
MANTMVQSAARDALRGRVMSVYMTVFAGTTPFGALVAGLVANSYGATGSLLLGGVVTITAAVVVALLARRITRTTDQEIRPSADYVPG